MKLKNPAKSLQLGSQDRHYYRTQTSALNYDRTSVFDSACQPKLKTAVLENVDLLGTILAGLVMA
jgi:hypothetical protein